MVRRELFRSTRTGNGVAVVEVRTGERIDRMPKRPAGPRSSGIGAGLDAQRQRDCAQGEQRMKARSPRLRSAGNVSLHIAGLCDDRDERVVAVHVVIGDPGPPTLLSPEVSQIVESRSIVTGSSSSGPAHRTMRV